MLLNLKVFKPVPVPTRENLIKIKRLSNRPQDIPDIEALEEAGEE